MDEAKEAGKKEETVELFNGDQVAKDPEGCLKILFERRQALIQQLTMFQAELQKLEGMAQVVGALMNAKKAPTPMLVKG